MPNLTPGDSALLILPPPSVAMAIQPWRTKYDPNAEIIPPHITLAYPSFVPQAHWADTKIRLAEVLARFQPFEIRLEESGLFSGQPAVLWLRPSDHGELACLHNTLQEEFAEYWTHSEFTFVPHLTIGFFASEALLAAAREELADQFSPQSFLVTKITYAVLDAAGKWRQVDSLPFRAVSMAPEE